MFKLFRKKWLSVIGTLAVLSGIAIAALNYDKLGAADFTRLKGPIDSKDYFTVRVVDSKTGRGIPMVELKTTGMIKFYTDSAGYVAFNEPGLMDQKVFFHVSSHGYVYPDTTFGYHGKAFDIKPGGSVTLKMDRINTAQRLYRITGQGIYRDSLELGISAPIDNPDTNSDVTGHKGASAVLYKGRIYWFWQDTKLLTEPESGFDLTGAVSLLPKDGGLNPSIGINLEYIKNEDGSLKSMITRLPSDPDTIAVSGFTVLPDKNGEEKLVAFYTLYETPQTPIEQGLVIFDDERQIFDKRIVLRTSQRGTLNAWDFPGGQAVKYEEGGKEYYLFTKEYPYFWPTLRIPAKLEEACDMNQYEVFTPFKEGIGFEDIKELLSDLSALKIAGKTARDYKDLGKYFDMDGNGDLIWSWKKYAVPLIQDTESKLYNYGLMDIDKARFLLKDKETGEELRIQSGTVHLNEYLKAWVLIGVSLDRGRVVNGELSGYCDLNNVWFAKAPSPVGPWTEAEKILTHDNYNFFNPVHHPFFDEDNGRIIYFEGTYSAEHSSSERALKTPFYDYNQIMYSLHLD